MIPVHSPLLGSEELENVSRAIGYGEISGSGGHYLTEFEKNFAEYCDCRYGVAVSSGSTALHIAAILAGVKDGDEVLMNACTNIACANAVAMQGGIVVPVDSEPDTWNMDPHLLGKLVTKRTKAIMPIHIYGHPVDMDLVLDFAKEHKLFIIEDCAEAHGATYWERKVGSMGDVGCFSFYANKVITTGEGGMIVTNDKTLAERARSLRNLAFGIPRFRHNEIGFNYRMTNVQAAIGCAQLKRIDYTLTKKRWIAQKYTMLLKGIAGLRLPVEKNYAKNIYWMYGVVVEDDFGTSRDSLMEQLRIHGVDTRTMFCPMHLQPSLLRSGNVKPNRCPVAEDLWENGFYLPSGCSLEENDIDVICSLIDEVGACV